MSDRHGCLRIAAGFALLAMVYLPVGLLAGCGASGSAASAVSPSPVEASGSPVLPAAATSPKASDLLMVRGALRHAYLRGQAGEPFKVEPALMAALRKSLASDPSMFNGASRAVLLWACPVEMPEYGYRSTPTRRYVTVLVWADGEEMVAAGTVAPGFSQTLMSLSRSSADEAWRVDGLWSP